MYDQWCKAAYFNCMAVSADDELLLIIISGWGWAF